MTDLLFHLTVTADECDGFLSGNSQVPRLCCIVARYDCAHQVINFFLSQKAALDAKTNPSPEDLVATCHALTTVRALIMGGLNR